MVMILLAASAAFATGQQVYLDNGNGDPNVWGNASDAANWYSPTATSDGALWLQTGSGAPVQYPYSAGDVNLELWVDVPDGSGGFAWSRLVTLLTSVPSDQYADASNNWIGTGFGDITFLGEGEPGFFDDYNEIAYQIPGTSNTTGPYDSFQMELYAWLGNYSSFSAAAAAGQPVADSGVFTQSVPFNTMLPAGDVDGMPATILKSVLPGDANLDGKVDINDLTIVLAHYGQTGMTWEQGEFTGDGTVDINDLTIVLAHYNDTLEAAAGGSTTAVPEPCAVALAAAGLAGIAGANAARKRGQRRGKWNWSVS
jgi:hypothetical protein